MKGRISYKSKRSFIIIFATLILAIIAGLGTYFYVSTKTESEATNLENKNLENNSDKEKNNDNITNQDTEDKNEENKQNEENNNNNQTTSKNQNTQVPTEENKVIKTETQLIETQKTIVGFNQSNLEIDIDSVTKLEGKLPKIEKKINSVTSENINAVLKGNEITYQINVKNQGKDLLENINVSAEIPEGTELIKKSISDKGTTENGKISWKIDVETEKTVEFTVKVIKEEGIIEASAFVEGKETSIIQTPIIKSLLNVSKTEANKEEILTYTISVENTALIPADIKIKATVPEETELVTEGLELLEKDIIWNKTLNALEKAEYSYDVKVKKYEKNYLIKNVAIVNGTETNKVETMTIDTIAPSIIIPGSSEFEVGIDTYVSENGKVIDNCDGEIDFSKVETHYYKVNDDGTRKKVTNFKENTKLTDYELGKYVITYEVSDKAGNLAKAERTIILQDTIKPEWVYPTNGTHGNPGVNIAGKDANFAYIEVYIQDTGKTYNEIRSAVTLL